MNPLHSAIVWDPSISPFSILGFEVRYYALCWMIGLLAAYFVVSKVYKNGGIKEELFDPLFFYCFFFRFQQKFYFQRFFIFIFQLSA